MTPAQNNKLDKIIEKIESLEDELQNPRPEEARALRRAIQVLQSIYTVAPA